MMTNAGQSSECSISPVSGLVIICYSYMDRDHHHTVTSHCPQLIFCEKVSLERESVIHWGPDKVSLSLARESLVHLGPVFQSQYCIIIRTGDKLWLQQDQKSTRAAYTEVIRLMSS